MAYTTPISDFKTSLIVVVYDISPAAERRKPPFKEEIYKNKFIHLNKRIYWFISKNYRLIIGDFYEIKRNKTFGT